MKANHYDEKFIPVYTGANVINCITQDSQKNLWVGTWGSGLIQLDSTGNRKIVYDDQNSGLLSNTVLKVIEKDGFLYLAHYQGAVQRISLSKGEFETLFQESGVIVNDMIETSGSTLLVSTTRGLVEINLTDKDLILFMQIIAIAIGLMTSEPVSSSKTAKGMCGSPEEQEYFGGIF